MMDTKELNVGRATHENQKIHHHPVDSLLDICSRNVAEYVPFQHIEERYQCRIPGMSYSNLPYFVIINHIHLQWTTYENIRELLFQNLFKNASYIGVSPVMRVIFAVTRHYLEYQLILFLLLMTHCIPLQHP